MIYRVNLLTWYLMIFVLWSATVARKLKKSIVISLKYRNLTEGHIDIESNYTETKSIFKRQGILPLKDYIRRDKDILYYGQISLGTPSKDFLVLFDTGSAETWVFGSPCPEDKLVKTCYIAEESSTAVDMDKSVRWKYEDGSIIKGDVYTDTVNIADLTISNQVFASSYYVTGVMGSSMLPFTGILGMAYSSISKLASPTVFENLVKTNLMSPVFGFYFARESLGETGSELTLGGYDKSKAVKVRYHKVIETEYWNIRMESVKVNGILATKTQNAIIDTGHVFNYGPVNQVLNVFQEISGSIYDSTYQKMSIVKYPCESPPIISFTFDGVDYPMSPHDFKRFQLKDPYLCVGSILGHESKNINWYLGIAFLKNVYTIFDMAENRVGFTSLTSTSGERILPVLSD